MGSRGCSYSVRLLSKQVIALGVAASALAGCGDSFSEGQQGGTRTGSGGNLSHDASAGRAGSAGTSSGGTSPAGGGSSGDGGRGASPEAGGNLDAGAGGNPNTGTGGAPVDGGAVTTGGTSGTGGSGGAGGGPGGAPATGGAGGSGGGCSNSTMGPASIARGQAPTEVIVDDSAAYFIDQGASAIVRVPLDCGPRKDFPNEASPRGFAQDTGYVYWATSSNNGEIRRLDKKSLIVDSIVTSLPSVRALAVDDTSVYYVQDVPNTGAVGLVPKAGGVAKPLFSNVDTARGVAVDAQYLYWTQWNQVRRVLKDGTPDGIVSTDEYGPSVLLVDATNLYWFGNNTAEIKRAPKTGSGAVRLVVWGDYQSFGLTIDSTDIYFAHSTTGTIERLPKDAAPGATSTVLAQNQSVPLGVAVDTTYVYWANNGDGRLMRLHK